jgi:IS30 family transposase
MNGSCGLNRKFLRSSATCRWAPQTTSESTGASHRADPDVELAVLPDSICRKREGDLLSGPRNSYIATLVERHTRYVMLAKVAGKDTRTVVSALIKQAKKLPREQKRAARSASNEADRYLIVAG